MVDGCSPLIQFSVKGVDQGKETSMAVPRASKSAFLLTTVLTLGLGFGMSAVQDAQAYTIYPPDSIVDGQSIADWTAAWWTRLLQYPAALVDPATESVLATLNNDGPVFFARTTSGDPSLGHVNLNFSVPFGRPILVPLIPFIDFEPASIDPPTASLADREHAADVTVAGWVASVDIASLFASIDGVSVPDPGSYLEETGYFSSGATQPDSVAASLGVTVGDDLFPSEAAGYWLMVDGLTLGPHTLDYGGSSAVFTPEPNCCDNSPVGPFAVDVTATIDVVPEPSSAFLLLAGALGVFALRRSTTRGARFPLS
jgi:hypothetical protein